jgi:hypothetical protein
LIHQDDVIETSFVYVRPSFSSFSRQITRHEICKPPARPGENKVKLSEGSPSGLVAKDFRHIFFHINEKCNNTNEQHN